MSRYDEQYFGIKVSSLEGEVLGYYDPCEKEPYVTELGNTIIENLQHTYEYTIPVTWEKYPLCSECGYEVEIDTGYCSSECKYNYVMEE